MLVDVNVQIRKDAVKKIIFARQNRDSSGVRKFLKLTREEINEEATEFHQIIKWETVECKLC